MTALIEPYSGFVLVWLLAGLGALLLVCIAAMILQINTRQIRLHTALALLVVAPAVLLMDGLKDAGSYAWKACQAWVEFWRTGTGFMPMLLGGFHLYLTWIYLDVLLAVEDVNPTLWWFPVLLVFTALVLWRCAGHLQQQWLSEKRNQKEQEAGASTPPPVSPQDALLLADRARVRRRRERAEIRLELADTASLHMAVLNYRFDMATREVKNRIRATAHRAQRGISAKMLTEK